jgi:hypothetical protein
VGETLAETRLEVTAQRSELEATAERLRSHVQRAFDLPAKFRENPALYGGLAAGALFLLAGGPRRLVRAGRRRLTPSRGDRAYDALPKPMRTWIDAAVGSGGERAADARRKLAEELLAWRNAPKGKRRAKELARDMAEGPPSASRALWGALEAAAVIVSTAVARRAVARLLAGDRPLEAAAELSPSRSDGETADSARPGYAGWSARRPAGR